MKISQIFLVVILFGYCTQNMKNFSSGWIEMPPDLLTKRTVLTSDLAKSIGYLYILQDKINKTIEEKLKLKLGDLQKVLPSHGCEPFSTGVNVDSCKIQWLGVGQHLKEGGFLIDEKNFKVIYNLPENGYSRKSILMNRKPITTYLNFYNDMKPPIKLIETDPREWGDKKYRSILFPWLCSIDKNRYRLLPTNEELQCKSE